MRNLGKVLAFHRRLVIIGFGCIGQGVLPLLLRHIEMEREQILILTSDKDGIGIACEYNVSHQIVPLTRENYRRILDPLLGPGDFMLNLSVDVSSAALIELCRVKCALYLDTCIEPWAGGYTDASMSASQRSNYALREAALALRRNAGPTAILTHGANPGMVSHLVKEALLNVARDQGYDNDAPASREGWARLAAALGIKVIHIAERDTQVAHPRKAPGEFLNTWSVDGFVGEGSQPAELGWGTHERLIPNDGRRHEFGCKAAIYLKRPGASTRLRTWIPVAGPVHGFLITHGESISIADYFTLGCGDEPVYRPSMRTLLSSPCGLSWFL